MRFGHCKHCWWWKKLKSIHLSTSDNGFCLFYMNETKETSYCPDYYNRKKGNKEECTLDEWLNDHPEIEINMSESI